MSITLTITDSAHPDDPETITAAGFLLAYLEGVTPRYLARGAVPLPPPWVVNALLKQVFAKMGVKA